jgi:inner membrane protein
LPTIFTHAFVGISGSALISKKSDFKKIVLLSIICSVLPDADVIGFKFGIKYSDFFGHRGFFHSIFFAVIVGVLMSSIFFRENRVFSKQWWKLSIYFGFITASHGLLDALTNGGLGVALLSPFDNYRCFFSATPILVSPINPDKFLTMRGLKILTNEFIWVWIPSITGAVSVRLVCTWRHSKR